jgi:hypothetical protein
VRALAALLLLGAVIISSCGWPCGNVHLKEFPSPNENRTAVIFNRGCGAGSGYATSVSVLRSWQWLPNRHSNAFAADMPRGYDTSGVSVEWESNTQLVVRYHPDAVVLRQTPVVKGVNIRYEKDPSLVKDRRKPDRS